MTHTRATDADLVQLIRSGDTAAFGELVRRYQGLIYGLAYHRVGDFTDAQDIAQEAFIKAFRSLSRLDEPERFAAWLKTITANECRMWLRGSRRYVPLEEAELMPSYAAAAAADWRRRERQAEIRRAVGLLPDRSRLIVTLHYLSGLSHKEIGEFLGVRANAVAQHLHRARQQLKEMLLTEIEEGYAMNRLPESFAEQVLGRIVLHPIVEGVFMTSEGEGDVRGITMAVTDYGAQKAYITFWTRADDLSEIVLGTIRGRTSEGAKGRALDSALELLKALDMKLNRVVLRLAGERKCRARVELSRGGEELAVDMRPSDAMGLAVRVNAPILAEEPVIRRGNVSEDDVPAPDFDMDSTLHNEEYLKIRQHDLIIDKVYEMGFSTEDCVDTVRFRKDEASGVLRVWLEAVPEREITFDLNEYAAGVEMTFDLARRRGPGGRMLGGDFTRGWTKRYKHLYCMFGEDARMRIVLEDPSPCGADAESSSVPSHRGVPIEEVTDSQYP